MTDPARWLDDADTPPELRDLLSSAEAPRALDAATRARLGARVARLALPATIVTWLSVKTAAAVGVAAGLVTAGTGVAISSYVDRQAAHVEAVPATAAPRAARKSPLSPPVETPALNPTPSLPEPVVSAPPPALPAPPRPGGLAEESLLLERARSALTTSPAEALSLCRTHAMRFPRGQLASERSLVELEALHRLGRHGEARALGQRLLQAGGDDLYRARIERVLQKIDGQR